MTRSGPGQRPGHVAGVVMLVASPGDDLQPAAGRRGRGWPVPLPEVCGERGGQELRAGLRGWASSQPSAAGPGCGWTSGGEDVGVSGLRDFLLVAVESGGLRSITL